MDPIIIAPLILGIPLIVIAALALDYIPIPKAPKAPTELHTERIDAPPYLDELRDLIAVEYLAHVDHGQPTFAIAAKCYAVADAMLKRRDYSGDE